MSEENSEWTVAKRSAWIDSGVFGFSRAIQAFGLDRFKKNCVKMYGGFNYVLAQMFPHTAQLMNPPLQSIIQLESGVTVTATDSSMSKLAQAAEHSLHEKAERVKEVAKKASDLAKKTARPMYAACHQSDQATQNETA